MQENAELRQQQTQAEERSRKADDRQKADAYKQVHCRFAAAASFGSSHSMLHALMLAQPLVPGFSKECFLSLHIKARGSQLEICLRWLSLGFAGW